MIEVKVSVSAPELVDAVNALAGALKNEKEKSFTHGLVNPEGMESTEALFSGPAGMYDQILTAGAALIDEGKHKELKQLLNSFGVDAVTQLEPEQFGPFISGMRELGAAI